MAGRRRHWFFKHKERLIAGPDFTPMSRGEKAGTSPAAQFRRSLTTEKLDPPSAWTDDADFYYLWLDLPEFKKEEVNIKVEEPNTFNVSGDRMAHDKGRRVRFESTFDVPESADMNNLTGKFDGGILCLTIPKQESGGNRTTTTINSYPINHQRTEIGPNSTGELTDMEFDVDSLRRFGCDVMETLGRNWIILFTAIVAFAVGLLLSTGKYPAGL